MDISKLTDGPELTVTIGGQEYQFSEVSIGALSRLQDWIKREHPHPLDAIKPYLSGLDPVDRQYLLEQARQEAKGWPPEIGTPEGAQALLGSLSGQVEALLVGLLVHQPKTTREDAERIYRQLKREGDLFRKIYRTIFGTGSQNEDEDWNGNGAPKAVAGKASPGIVFSGLPNSD